MDGALKFESPVVEEHIRKRTSFVAPEANIAAEMLKAPGVVREGRTATGASIVTWLKEKRGIDETAAKAYAQRMVDLDIISPKDGGPKVFNPDRIAVYRVAAAVGR
jgi:hypothetical protein